MYADQRAINAVLEFKRDWKPQILVHLGDVWDLPNLRRGATDSEVNLEIEEDWDQGRWFSSQFFEGPGEKYQLLGNHDWRAWELLDNFNGAQRHYGNDLVRQATTMWDRLKVKWFPYDARSGVLKLGHLRVLHGYHHGVNACATHARIYGNVVFGHIHSIESFCVPGLEEKEARSIGCLCTLDPKYMRARTGKLRWAHGWAYGVLFDSGFYHIFQARKIGEQFVVSEGLKVL